MRRNLVRRGFVRHVLVHVLVLGLAGGSMRLVAYAAAWLAIARASPVATLSPGPAAAVPSDAALAAFADCTAVSTADATRLLGYDVLPPDERARAGGDCFFASQSMSQDGSVSYSLVTAARLAKLRPYFIAMARRCSGVQPSSPRAVACAEYVKLAGVADLDSYYAARTTLRDAAPIAGVGDGSKGAVSAGGTLFVREAGIVLEAAIRRDGDFDVERSKALARLLLDRLREPAPGPAPSGV